ncbi:MerR family transcriptional regulator [Ramlibacter humi]|uniref:MerR family transcriptional regulator n=1 Tax=Ramlibacter humi TaxID=2530451 RepID=A0A4Z0C7K0_9BURK|nr:MerR family transcriptional regulator [Ramlibacter humi]TFZ07647.1 MerR family transcriptional regulator [Ramlibacter humi]
MLLKVGELARSTGLTVRTLHHYDAIGLVKPSARSEAGYRLYDTGDVARLHAVQALRHLGLPLAEIGPLLDGKGAPPEAILAQQIQALDRQVRQATELRDRLSLLREGLLRGESPSLQDWVGSLSLMATYGRYFEAGELQRILSGWNRNAAEWDQLKAGVRAAMDAGLKRDTMEVQALTRRWMGLVYRVMGGDHDLMQRWGQMYRRETSAHGLNGAPPTDMLDFMEDSIEFRLGLLRQHFSVEDLTAMRWPEDTERRLQAIEDESCEAMAAGRAPASKQARALRARWQALLGEAAGGDPALLGRMLTLHRAHPLLLAGGPLSGEVRAWLVSAGDPGA